MEDPRPRFARSGRPRLVPASRVEAQPASRVQWEYLELRRNNVADDATALRAQYVATLFGSDRPSNRIFNAVRAKPIPDDQLALAVAAVRAEAQSAALFALGYEGWELVTVLEGSPAIAGDARTWIFKRQVVGS